MTGETGEREPGPAGTERPVLLRAGFRPFFLLAGLYAVLSMAVWLAWMALHLAQGQVLGSTIAIPLYLWHAHEMLFGFAAAVIAGFMLTAVPNWTGAPALAGGALAGLVAAWLAGRVAVAFSAFVPPLLVALLDLAFLPLLGLAVAVPLVRARAGRNLVFLLLLAVMVAANGLAHLEWLGVLDDGVAMGHLLAVDLLVLLITIVGGRIVPAFTQGWLDRERPGEAVARRPWLDGLTIAATAAVLIVDLASGDEALRGALALAAALLHLARLMGWRTRAVLGTPILWVLHAGYGWLVVGFACKALALLAGALPEVTALHAFTAGAAGTMTLAVMSRAALGHTGRALHAAPPLVGAYVSVTLGALVRVAGPALLPGEYMAVMLVSGVLWTLAFALFAGAFWPVLARPRPDGKPG